MPIYEYRCAECGNIFSAFRQSGQGMDDLSCPACESDVITKIFSMFSPKAGASRSATSTSSCGGSSSGFR